MLSNVFMVKLPQLFLVLSHLPDPTAQFQHPIVCESHSLEYHSILFVMKLFYILFPTVSFIFTGTKLFSMKLHVSYCKTLSDFVTSHMNQNKKRRQTLESAQYGLEICTLNFRPRFLESRLALIMD